MQRFVWPRRIAHTRSSVGITGRRRCTSACIRPFSRLGVTEPSPYCGGKTRKKRIVQLQKKTLLTPPLQRRARLVPRTPGPQPGCAGSPPLSATGSGARAARFGAGQTANTTAALSCHLGWHFASSTPPGMPANPINVVSG
jgi:hypothetical protein